MPFDENRPSLIVSSTSMEDGSYNVFTRNPCINQSSREKLLVVWCRLAVKRLEREDSILVFLKFTIFLPLVYLWNQERLYEEGQWICVWVSVYRESAGMLPDPSDMLERVWGKGGKQSAHQPSIYDERHNTWLRACCAYKTKIPRYIPLPLIFNTNLSLEMGTRTGNGCSLSASLSYRLAYLENLFHIKFPELPIFDIQLCVHEPSQSTVSVHYPGHFGWKFGKAYSRSPLRESWNSCLIGRLLNERMKIHLAALAPF